MKPTRVTSISSRYATKVIARINKFGAPSESGCIEWIGSLDRSGYGRFRIADSGIRKETGAHRAAWLAHRGKIPGDLVIDHLCRNRKCVNVEHMELVTNAENARRADHSGKAGRSGTRPGGKEGCGRHGKADGFERTRKDGYTTWHCRPCTKRRFKEWQARQDLQAA